jgi:hypothetical protein
MFDGCLPISFCLFGADVGVAKGDIFLGSVMYGANRLDMTD